MPAAGRRMTIGAIILVAVMLLVFFDPLTSALRWFVSTYGRLLAPFVNVTFTTGPFTEFGNFLVATWQWMGYVFITPIALAALIVIAIIYEAMETRWR